MKYMTKAKRLFASVILQHLMNKNCIQPSSGFGGAVTIIFKLNLSNALKAQAYILTIHFFKSGNPIHLIALVIKSKIKVFQVSKCVQCKS